MRRLSLLSRLNSPLGPLNLCDDLFMIDLLGVSSLALVFLLLITLRNSVSRSPFFSAPRCSHPSSPQTGA